MDNYKLKEELGNGTYGSVYRAVEVKTGKVVAIKQVDIINKEEGVPGTALREISIMLELDNPHIASIYDIISKDDKIFMIMEYCNTDLRKFLD